MFAGVDIGEIRSLFGRLGVAGQRYVVVITDLAALGRGAGAGERAGVAALYDALNEAAGDGVTLCAPTFTYHRTGPDSPYVHETSASETGAVSEHLRVRTGASRSVHPVFSFAAIGPRAKELCENAAAHSYGYGSVTHRLVEGDALVVSIGRSPHRGGFFIHLAEVFAGVPYRYSKELSIPVVVGSRVQPGPYFHHVKWRDSDIEWDTNRLVDRMTNRGEVAFEALGDSGVWCYRAAAMYESTMAILKRNIYGLLAAPPQRRPWAR